MSVIRSDISAGNLPKLYDAIDRRIELIGVETAPEVAARLTELSMDAQAGPSDFAKVIRHDAALSGRLLRLANSAYFAQRAPVTRIDRAAVLLGIDRLRTVSLGFYTPARRADDPETLRTRELWSACLYRGILAMELAQDVCPNAKAEAFAVGMLLDVGESSMDRLLGSRYRTVRAETSRPRAVFDAEYGTLPFTHIDVAATLCRRWHVPDVIAKPIRWHHTMPKDLSRNETLHQLHRIAYVVGDIEFSPTRTKLRAELPTRYTHEFLDLDHRRTDAITRRAFEAYASTIEEYESLLKDIPDIAGVIERGPRKLVDEFDSALLRTVREPQSSTATARFIVGSYDIEIEPGDAGAATAYVLNADGERIASQRFSTNESAKAAIFDGLFIEPDPDESMDALDAYLDRLAA